MSYLSILSLLICSAVSGFVIYSLCNKSSNTNQATNTITAHWKFKFSTKREETRTPTIVNECGFCHTPIWARARNQVKNSDYMIVNTTTFHWRN